MKKIIITKRIRHGYNPLWRVCHGCFCVSNIWFFFCQQNILSSILISKFQYSNNLGQHTLYRITKITGKGVSAPSHDDDFNKILRFMSKVYLFFYYFSKWNCRSKIDTRQTSQLFMLVDYKTVINLMLLRRFNQKISKYPFSSHMLNLKSTRFPTKKNV
jgi:hypothetical protein